MTIRVVPSESEAVHQEAEHYERLPYEQGGSPTPALPYPEPGGQESTAGHSGSETSRERAVSEARGKIVQRRQQRVLGLLHVQQTDGLTVVDLRDITGWHHGQASSTLSTLHQRGIIERLTERRDKCLVYVLPEYVGERQTTPYRKNKRDLSEQESEIQRLRGENALLRDRLASNKRIAQYGAWSGWRDKLLAAAACEHEREIVERIIAVVVEESRG